MRDNLFHNIANLFRLSQKHLQSPVKEMSTGTLNENFGDGQAIRRFVTPIAVTLAAASAVSSLLWGSEMNFGAMVYGILTSAIEPFIIYYLVKVLSCKVFRKFGIEDDTEEKAQVVTLQLMLLYFAVTFVCSILPGARLLLCFYVYAFYMLWQMAGDFLRISDERRLSFMLSEMAICAVSYVIALLLLNVIAPKHP